MQTSPSTAAFPAGQSPAAAKLEETEILMLSTNSWLKIFSTPQKTKAFCELFLSHSDPKRTEVLKYFFNIIGSQGFEHQNLKGRNPLNTSAFDAEVGKDLPETLFRVFLLLIHVCLQQPIAGQKTWARCQDYLNCLAEGARRSWFLLGSIYF